MKFVIPLLSLLSVTSVFARIDLVSVAACQHDVDESYENCYNFENARRQDLQYICRSFYSEKCQNFYKEGVKRIGDCRTLDLENLTYVNDIYNSKMNDLELICTTNENSQPCPFFEYGIANENTNLSSRELYNKCVNDTCMSKKCTISAIGIMNKEIELRKSIGNAPKTKFDSSKFNGPYDGAKVKAEDEIAYNIAFFNSNYCISQYQNNAQNTQVTNTQNQNNAQNSQNQNTPNNTQQGNVTSDATTSFKSYQLFMILILLCALL